MAQKKKQKRSTQGRSSTKSKQKSSSNSQGKKKNSRASSMKMVMGGGSREGRESGDIVKLILEDHKALKEMIETLKDEEADTDEKMAVFDEFAPTLVAHAKPEEQTLYKAMKENDELRSQGFEGEVEHTLADQLLEEIKRTKDEDEWCAKVKVVAELVEHHIEEEEESLLPDYKSESDTDEREQLGAQFLELKAEIESEGSDDAPPEATIEEEAS